MSDLDHRRFLKRKDPKVLLGTYFPDTLKVKEDKIIDLNYIKNVEKGSIVFIMNPTCEACNFEPMVDFQNKYDRFAYLVLLDADVEIKKGLEETTSIQLNIELCDMELVDKELGHNVIPWVFVINNVGQIVGCGIFNDLRTLELIAKPLIKVSYQDMLVM